MTIAAILASNPHEVVTIPGDMRVADAVAVLSDKRIGALPVMDGGAVAGIFSERDVIHCLHVEGAGVLDWPVKRVMTSPAVTVGKGERIIGALSLMTQRRIRHLPVVEQGELVGFVSIGDLVKYRIDRIEEEAMAMREYIQGA